MSIQDNVLYSELSKVPKVSTEDQLSLLERDFFGKISVSQLMNNYSQLNNNDSHLLDHQASQRPVVALCLENSVSDTSYVTKPLVEDIGLYSTLERRSLSSHYEIQDHIQEDTGENYTQINQLNKTQNQENFYESLIRSEERGESCKIIKVATNNSRPIPNDPDVIYSAIHR